MQQLVVVGAGDYLFRIVGPTLQKFASEGLLEVAAIVSLEPNGPTEWLQALHATYIRRPPQGSLVSVLRDFNPATTIVLLAHRNDLHYPEAAELITAGYAVMVEKPFCSKVSEIRGWQNILNAATTRCALLEYYLLMKSVPLLIAFDLVAKNSFYSTVPGLMLPPPGINLPFAIEQMRQIVKNLGKIISIEAAVLEGEGAVGRLDHRGAYLSSRQNGGGMLLDLGIHAVAPLYALREIIGEMPKDFKNGSVKVARCSEYIAMATEKFGLPIDDIAESYVEALTTTTKGIPVKVSVGKYILPNQNYRHITLHGEHGDLFLDMSDCSLHWRSGVESQHLLTIPKIPETKYYPVLRAALEIINKSISFHFSPSQAALDAQAWVLAVRESAYQNFSRVPTYAADVKPETIFVT